MIPPWKGRSPLGKALTSCFPAVLSALLLINFAAPAMADTPGDPGRGAYVFRAAGCYACHTEDKEGAKALAGGRALATPFGTFYSPNITPDKTHGLGGWTLEDFRTALRDGLAPDGSTYFPSFPYTSYSGMTDGDIADLWAYLQTVPAVARPSRNHELDFPFGFRELASLWQAMFFESATYQADRGKDETWNRGAYLVRHLGHCGECHSARNVLGAVDEDKPLAGNPSGPEGKKVPNITPHPKDGIGSWSEGDIAYYLFQGLLPDGDVVGGAMEEVVREGTSHLTEADRKAIAVYLKSLPANPGP